MTTGIRSSPASCAARNRRSPATIWVAVERLRHEDRQEHTVVGDARGETFELCLAHVSPGLERVRPDAREGDFGRAGGRRCAGGSARPGRARVRSGVRNGRSCCSCLDGLTDGLRTGR
jgi:hypothetical protein